MRVRVAVGLWGQLRVCRDGSRTRSHPCPRVVRTRAHIKRRPPPPPSTKVPVGKPRSPSIKEISYISQSTTQNSALSTGSQTWLLQSTQPSRPGCLTRSSTHHLSSPYKHRRTAAPLAEGPKRGWSERCLVNKTAKPSAGVSGEEEDEAYGREVHHLSFVCAPSRGMFRSLQPDVSCLFLPNLQPDISCLFFPKHHSTKFSVKLSVLPAGRRTCTPVPARRRMLVAKPGVRGTSTCRSSELAAAVEGTPPPRPQLVHPCRG